MFDRFSQLLRAILVAQRIGISLPHALRLLQVRKRFSDQFSKEDSACEGTQLPELFSDWKKGRDQVITNTLQPLQLTLDDIRREATDLEIDMCTDDGHLDLTKRGDPSLYYRSLYPLDDPRIVQDAWQWLQHYRVHAPRIHEARAYLAGQKRSNTYSILLILPALAGGLAVYLLTHRLLLGCGAYLTLALTAFLLSHLMKRRAS
jgi:hypothetical protein